MASNKNQHFVPRAYLKPFSQGQSGKAINVFNIDRLCSIQNAAVKHQCSGDYFYGEDLRVEKWLQNFESRYAQMIREIHQPGYSLTVEHATQLKKFWLIQYLRTDAASRRTVEMTTEVEDAAGVAAQQFKLNIKEAVQIAMGIFPQVEHVIDDLKICLVRNRSLQPFITSDDPAILTNRWYSYDRRTIGESPGLISAGALLLLPLSSEILCLGFDDGLHQIITSNGWFTTKRDSDVQSFNQHQLINCQANIYFRDWQYREQIRSSFNAVVGKRPPVRYKINYAVLEHENYGRKIFRAATKSEFKEGGNALIHHQAIRPVPTEWPRFLNIRAHASAYTNGTGMGYVRKAQVTRSESSEFKKIRI